jgi:23S rRNA pseudouridine2605 synthase
VGRLDRDTSGLLILTNDHRLGQRLSDPVHGVAKTYHARVAGVPERAALQALREGVPLGDGATSRPAGVRVLGASRAGTWLEIVLREGRNRQVRRMCAAVGHEVLELARVAIGGLSLGALPAGEWRRLQAEEVASLGAPRGRIGHRPRTGRV